MPSSISPAVDEIVRLPDIQFPEFTSKLITDTFDAIISANLRQTESYIELVGALAKTLSEYINDTKDDISGAEILQFVATLLPGPDEQHPTKIASGATLAGPEATKLTTALTIAGEAAPPAIPTAALTASDVSAIKDAVAKRLAANKYTLLKEMVKIGLVRVVINGGKIISQLTFSTYASSFYVRNSSSYNSSNFDLTVKANTGSALSKWFSASASARYTSVSVRTTNESQQDVSGSSVNIFGRVELDFKTDYLPLSQ
jgi:hypothetical protein